MHIVPDSSITLYSHIETSRKLVFSSVASQQAYYGRHVALQYAPCTVIKKTGRLRVEVAGTVLKNCNFISFVNPHFDNKIFYARIIDYEYINNECADITYGIDYFQSFMFDVTFRECYIDREHLSEEDYAKSIVNPYDPSILEFQTDEGLPVGRELENRIYNSSGSWVEDNVMSSDSGKVLQYIGGGSPVLPKHITVIAVSKIEPPTDSDVTWYANFKKKCGYNYTAGYAEQSAAALGYINGTDPAPRNNTVWMNKAMYTEFGVSFTTPMQTFPPAELSTAMSHPYDIFLIKDTSSTTELQDFIDKITSWNCINAIIGIYAMPRNVLTGIFDWTVENLASYSNIWPLPIAVENSNTQFGQSVTNKKLLTFPYAYVRVEAPDGAAKEFRYEDFANVYNMGSVGDNKYAGRPTFLVDGNICGEPVVSIIPAWYKRMNIDQCGGARPIDELQSSALNYYERIDFKSFPQMPYNTDAFLAAMAAQAQDIRRNNTRETQYALSSERYGNMADYEYLSGALAENSVDKLSNIIRVGESVLGTTGSAAGQTGTFTIDNATIASGAKGLLSAENSRATLLQQANQWADKMNAYEYKKAMYDTVDDFSTETLNEDNGIYNNFKSTKRGYAASDYHPSTGGGLEYYQYLSPFDFIVTRVKLRDEIIAKYDNYFSAYGYKSDRYGVPRIANFINGGSSNRPTFMRVGSFDVTYIKTYDLNIDYPIMQVENYFRTMFNSGVQLINGDNLS